jgi:hypothetical protein
MLNFKIKKIKNKSSKDISMRDHSENKKKPKEKNVHYNVFLPMFFSNVQFLQFLPKDNDLTENPAKSKKKNL